MDSLSALDDLNPAQRQAVTAPLGNLLVLAGAGSGKTRVLVRRVWWLILHNAVSENSVLAVTFTNKAAQEMRSRLESMLGRGIYGMWVGTFHGLAHKLLRLHWKEAGLPQNFQVLDSDDQLQMIKRIFKAMAVNEERFDPKKVQGYINRKKDEGTRPNHLPTVDGIYDQVLNDIYRQYELQCQQNGLVDFAEILLRSYELLKNNAELVAHYQARFLHFLVDEFQDINTIQFKWLSLLAQGAKSVTVVGDDDQSIYGWRGAKVENIRRFERDYPETFVVRLEQNYRSTQTILSAANALISCNASRLGKTLWTEGDKGAPIALYGGFNEEDEALYVVRQVKSWIEDQGSAEDIAVLYRSNAQSRVLEEAFVRAGIAYRIYGGLRFFERAEIKDVLAYLRLAVNPQDNTSFERVVNMPPRGIGDKSLEKVLELAAERNCAYWEAAKLVVEHNLISGKARSGLQTFLQLIELMQCQMTDVTLSKLTEIAIRETGLLRFYQEQLGEKAQNRVENLEELVNATHDFESELPEEEKAPLIAFLSYSSLDAGERTKNDEKQGVQLMTLHSAKGLEFPLVFICGLEDGLFPHHFSRESKDALEEERRLCYVGITRAMQVLHLTYAEKRRIFGRDEMRRMSPFINEIPEHLIKDTSRKVSIKPAMTREIQTKVFQHPLSSRSTSDSGFVLGQRVEHNKFGQGTVLDYEGTGDRTRVHVHFDMHGSKWLALAYAKLESVM